jgi:hypothetical protein
MCALAVRNPTLSPESSEEIRATVRFQEAGAHR